MKDGGLAPILKIAGIGLMCVTGAWGIGLCIAVAMLIDKHGKQLKAAFDLAWAKFANSKGVITKMDFGIKDKPDLKYSMRFYVKDKVWGVVNVSNQLKQPNKDFVKTIITGETGKKFVDRVIEIWDPVFSKEKGGKVDFASLIKQSKEVALDDKQVKALEDFRQQYDDIKSNM